MKKAIARLLNNDFKKKTIKYNLCTINIKIIVIIINHVCYPLAENGEISEAINDRGGMYSQQLCEYALPKKKKKRNIVKQRVPSPLLFHTKN